jgi:hypothetical protein
MAVSADFTVLALSKYTAVHIFETLGTLRVSGAQPYHREREREREPSNKVQEKIKKISDSIFL